MSDIIFKVTMSPCNRQFWRKNKGRIIDRVVWATKRVITIPQGNKRAHMAINE